MVTLCCVSSSLAPTTPAQIRLKRNWLILLPQVTANEMVLPLAIVSTPAEAMTTAVVNAAMGILRQRILALPERHATDAADRSADPASNPFVRRVRLERSRPQRRWRHVRAALRAAGSRQVLRLRCPGEDRSVHLSPVWHDGEARARGNGCQSLRRRLAALRDPLEYGLGYLGQLLAELLGRSLDPVRRGRGILRSVAPAIFPGISGHVLRGRRRVEAGHHRRGRPAREDRVLLHRAGDRGPEH